MNEEDSSTATEEVQDEASHAQGVTLPAASHESITALSILCSRSNITDVFIKYNIPYSTVCQLAQHKAIQFSPSLFTAKGTKSYANWQNIKEDAKRLILADLVKTQNAQSMQPFLATNEKVCMDISKAIAAQLKNKENAQGYITRYLGRSNVLEPWFVYTGYYGTSANGTSPTKQYALEYMQVTAKGRTRKNKKMLQCMRDDSVFSIDVDVTITCASFDVGRAIWMLQGSGISVTAAQLVTAIQWTTEH